MYSYSDPLADVFGDTYSTPKPAVFRPLPRPAIALVQPAPQPAPALLADDDLDGFDLGPVPDEPDHIREWFATFDDVQSDPANDDSTPPAVQTTVAPPMQEPTTKRKAPREKPTGKPNPLVGNVKPFKLNLEIRSSHKMMWLEWVMADASLTPTTRNIAFSVANRVNKDTGFAWDTLSNYAASAGCEWQAAQRAVRRLTEAGYLAFQPTEGGALNIALNADFFRPRVLPDRGATTKRDARRGKRDEATPVPPDTPTPVPPDTSPLSRQTPNNRKGEPEIQPESGKSENEAASASSVRGLTGFDRDWITFQGAYPAAIDETWRPLFLRIRREGWSLQQLLDGIVHLQRNMCEGQEFWNVAGFLNNEMWRDQNLNESPEHHTWEYERDYTGDEDLDADIPF